MVSMRLKTSKRTWITFFRVMMLSSHSGKHPPAGSGLSSSLELSKFSWKTSKSSAQMVSRKPSQKTKMKMAKKSGKRMTLTHLKMKVSWAGVRMSNGGLEAKPMKSVPSPMTIC